ncbi:unnamed protein product [Arabis nemorensis]|uniref:Uncharacterized protein n=1 Tax=Arabis nemorensis TaxID=586526 RepID=A0A565C0C6_9BRAS|nr:unnamed protein product [Arabis nemorensis]
MEVSPDGLNKETKILKPTADISRPKLMTKGIKDQRSYVPSQTDKENRTEQEGKRGENQAGSTEGQGNRYAPLSSLKEDDSDC